MSRLVFLSLLLFVQPASAGYIVKYYCVQFPVGGNLLVRHLNDHEVCCKEIAFYTDAHITLTKCNKGIAEVLNPNNVFVKEVYYENKNAQVIIDKAHNYKAPN